MGGTRVGLLAVGLSSHLQQLGSPRSQLILVAAPVVGLRLGEMHPKGQAVAGAVTPAPRCTLGSWLTGAVGKAVSDLMLDSGINKQSNDGISCQDPLMPLQKQSLRCRTFRVCEPLLNL